MLEKIKCYSYRILQNDISKCICGGGIRISKLGVGVRVKGFEMVKGLGEKQ